MVGEKKIIFPEFDCVFSCTKQFPLAVQIIFKKKQMLRALREFLKCRGVVVNSKTLDTGEKAQALVITRTN